MRSGKRALPAVEGPISTYLYYTTFILACQAFSAKNFQQKIQVLIPGFWCIITIIFATITTCYIIKCELVWMSAIVATFTFSITSVFMRLALFPHGVEIIAFFHRIFKSTLARELSIFIIRTVPTIYRTMEMTFNLHTHTPLTFFLRLCNENVWVIV